VIELTIGREESNLKEFGIQYHHVDLVPVISFVSSRLSFDWFCLLVETLGRQVIGSLTDVVESSINFLARDFGFERRRLRSFKRRRVCMRRQMKVIGFLEFLALRFINLRLGLFFTKLTLAFSSDLGLKFYLCWSSM